MRAAAWSFAVLLLPVAGCLADEAPPAAEALDEGAAALPDEDVTAERSAESIAFQETNRTEEGIGGMTHEHDYWKGRDRVDVISRRVSVSPFPVLGARNEVGSQSPDIQPPAPNLVFEGTVQIEVLLKEPLIFRPNGPDGSALAEAPHPAPPVLDLWYLTPADGALQWRDAGPVAYGTPVVIAVAEEQVDMPHSLASLWLFRLVTDGSHSFGLNITVTAVRGDDAPVWPGHPDFYAERAQRLVMEKPGKTTEEGGGASLVKDYGYDYVNPDKLISWGTTHLVVFANVTRVAYGGQGPVDPLSLYLRVRNATSQRDDVYGFDDIGSGSRREFVFEVPVDANGMDSPYAPSSRWGFAMGAFYTAFSDSSPYEVDYTMTIYAVGESGDRPPDASETDEEATARRR